MNKFKLFRIPCILILVGTICMITSNSFVLNDKDEQTHSWDSSDTSISNNIQTFSDHSGITDWRVIMEYHQNRLTDLLQQVKGVGTVSVLVSCDRSSILSLAADSIQDTSTIHEKDSNGGERVTENSKNQTNYLIIQDQNGNQKVVALSETIPAITSVCVVCSGGNQASVQERVIQAVQTLYHLSPSDIAVVPSA